MVGDDPLQLAVVRRGSLKRPHRGRCVRILALTRGQADAGHMTPETADGPARRGWRLWFGMSALGLLGWVLAGFAAIASFFVLFGTGASINTVFLVFSALTAAPAVAMWFSRNRYWRSLSAGLASAWLVVLCLVLWHPWSTMSSEEVARATAEIRDSGFPAYYLGPRSGGLAWNDYYLDEDQANFLYGKCHPGPDDAEYGCTTWDIFVSNERTDPALTGDFIEGCKRLDPVLGVPAVTLKSDQRSGDDLGVFPGSTMVILDFGEATTSLDEKVSVAKGLRAIGAPLSATLPSASDKAVAYVERYCGPEPR